MLFYFRGFLALISSAHTVGQRSGTAFHSCLNLTPTCQHRPVKWVPVHMWAFVSHLLCLSGSPHQAEITYNNSWGAVVILRVSGAPCGPILMSHMWPVKKDPSDLPIRLITTQYILMSRVRSYTYNIHIHSTHAGSYMYLNDMDINSIPVIFIFFCVLFYNRQMCTPISLLLC